VSKDVLTSKALMNSESTVTSIEISGFPPREIKPISAVSPTKAVT
jgi:hypothetical protein